MSSSACRVSVKSVVYASRFALAARAMRRFQSYIFRNFSGEVAPAFPWTQPETILLWRGPRSGRALRDRGVQHLR